MVNPMPKKSTPNRQFFIRSTRSVNTSKGTPVSFSISVEILTPFTRARSAHNTSKSFPGFGRIRISATPALFVFLTSTSTTVRSFLPFGVNIPFGVTA